MKPYRARREIHTHTHTSHSLAVLHIVWRMFLWFECKVLFARQIYRSACDKDIKWPKSIFDTQSVVTKPLRRVYLVLELDVMFQTTFIMSSRFRKRRYRFCSSSSDEGKTQVIQIWMIVSNYNRKFNVKLGKHGGFCCSLIVCKVLFIYCDKTRWCAYFDRSRAWKYFGAKPAGDGSTSAMCCCGLMHFNENNTFSLS